MEHTTDFLPRAAVPEMAQVSSEILQNFLEDAQKEHLEFHSVMVIRHGKIAFEFYNKPFGPNRPHQMYSISKSVTSTAIGFAVDEGLISVEDTVKDFFPDYTENLKDERLDQLKVKHLLSMTSGKETSFVSDKGKIDWIQDYFSSPWYADPGEKFKYINENIYMLCAILVRVTGMSVREYLKPRLFEPLDIAVPFWETDQNGIEAGGWGLYLKTSDLAKIMLCYHQQGMFNGKQVIPAEWTRIAPQAQSEDSVQQLGGQQNSGYGYCFWRNGDGHGSYRADGMFSQFGMVFSEHDAVVVFTSAIPNEDISRKFIWKYFPAAFDEYDNGSKTETAPRLQELTENQSMPLPVCSERSTREVMIDGREIRFRKKIFLNLIGFPMSVLPLAVVYMTTDKAGNIDHVRLKFGDKECTMDWTEGDEFNSAVCGMDGQYRYGTIRLGGIDYKICANAHWQDQDNLVLNIRPIETVGKRILHFRFLSNDRVELSPSSTPDIEQIAESLVGFVTEFLGIQKLEGFIRFVMTRLLPNIIEPKMKGTIRKD